ncbi:hypothetical protein KY360_02030 [Candidatus Woesearchaeota archaeon]|nr:hypothetical protein [Candidatus Woesearchaeota archaeon]
MKKREYRDLCGQWLYCKKNSRKKSDWLPIKVPSNWYLQGLDHHGLLYYKRNFLMDKIKKNKAVYLMFNGIDYIADIWLNDHYIGHHEGYFQRFGYNVTRLLKKRNELVVRVNSPKESLKDWPDHKKLVKGIFNLHDTRPGGWNPSKGQDKNTGGIWNSVELMITSNIVRPRRAYLHATSISKKRAEIKCEVKFFLKKEAEFELKTIFEPLNFKGRTISFPTKTIKEQRGFQGTQFTLEVKNPKLWWPWDHGFPNMYKVTFQIIHGGKIIDVLVKRFGIRTFNVDKKEQWWINNRRIFPRGVNFIPAQWLSEYDNEKIDKDISLLKKANVNAIRVHGHVNREELYDACDKAGILVYQDFALQWGYSNKKRFIKNASKQAEYMISYLFNHPSIVVWCCHNEPYGEKSDLDTAVHRIIKRADKTRNIVYGSLFTEHAYPGWYYGHYKEFSGVPAGPLVTEFGAQALPNVESLKKIISKESLWPPNTDIWAYHNFRKEQTFEVAMIKKGRGITEFVRNSQEYQSELLKYAIETMRRKKYGKVTGLFQFMFVDNWPSITWSVVDYYRQPKKGYHTLKQAYQPILVSISIKRRPLAIFSIKGNKESTNVLWDTMQVIWVTNDTHKKYKNAKLVLKVEGENGKVYAKRVRTINIPKDSSIPVIKPRSRFKAILNIKGILPADRYILRMSIWYRRRKISENFEYFRTIRRQEI